MRTIGQRPAKGIRLWSSLLPPDACIDLLHKPLAHHIPKLLLLGDTVKQGLVLLHAADEEIEEEPSPIQRRGIRCSIVISQRALSVSAPTRMDSATATGDIFWLVKATGAKLSEKSKVSPAASTKGTSSRAIP